MDCYFLLQELIQCSLRTMKQAMICIIVMFTYPKPIMTEALRSHYGLKETLTHLLSKEEQLYLQTEKQCTSHVSIQKTKVKLESMLHDSLMVVGQNHLNWGKTSI